MQKPKIISVAKLSHDHAEEIRAMAQGIDAPAQSQVWTATMRASIRGGKPCGLNQIDETERD